MGWNKSQNLAKVLVIKIVQWVGIKVLNLAKLLLKNCTMGWNKSKNLAKVFIRKILQWVVIKVLNLAKLLLKKLYNGVE